MTIYERNNRGLCITDHHDITEEDIHYAMMGSEEELFWEDFFRPRVNIFAGRSKEWIEQYNASRMRGPRD